MLETLQAVRRWKQADRLREVQELVQVQAMNQVWAIICSCLKDGGFSKLVYVGSPGPYYHV